MIEIMRAQKPSKAGVGIERFRFAQRLSNAISSKERSMIFVLTQIHRERVQHPSLHVWIVFLLYQFLLEKRNGLRRVFTDGEGMLKRDRSCGINRCHPDPPARFNFTRHRARA